MAGRDEKESEPALKSDPHNVDRRLLELLVCPVTRQALDYRRESEELVSRAAKLAYPIRDGIPIMLAEEARELGDDEF